MKKRFWMATVLAAGTLVVGNALGFDLFAAHSLKRWTRGEVALLASLRLSELPAAPRDPSNRYEDSPAAVELGRRLFFDARLSRNGAVSCASCHDPARAFQDGLAVAKGLATGTRRTMPIIGAGHSPWLFWDGRKDSLWSQALGPLEDGAEHGGNRLRLARAVEAHHGQAYFQTFGALPDMSRLPQDAGPLGTEAEKAAWKAMDEASRDGVSRVFANLGKAIAVYEKSLRPDESRLDRYIKGVVSGNPAGQRELAADEVRGLRLFVGKGQCVTCHGGPLLTDQHFHNTGVASRDAARPDRGRAAALAKVRLDEFNCLGRYSDAKPDQCDELRFMATQDPGLEGAFKTPGLRDVAARPPYMHAGQIASLEDVVRHYVEAPHAAVGRSELGHAHERGSTAKTGQEDRQPIELSEVEQKDLVALLRALSTVVTPAEPALRDATASLGR